jgi:DNA-damage-inducible protein J
MINPQYGVEVFIVQDTINVTIRLDRRVKENAEKLFDDLGMNLSTAFNIFARQALRQGKIPFEIFDPFYGEKNQAELSRRINEVEAGKNLSTHELIEVGDE